MLPGQIGALITSVQLFKKRLHDLFDARLDRSKLKLLGIRKRLFGWTHVKAACFQRHFDNQLGLWDRRARPPPKATGPPKVQEYSIDYSASQLPESTCRLSGGSDKWLYAEGHVFSVIGPEYPEVSPPPKGHTA